MWLLESCGHIRTIDTTLKISYSWIHGFKLENVNWVALNVTVF